MTLHDFAPVGGLFVFIMAVIGVMYYGFPLVMWANKRWRNK